MSARRCGGGDDAEDTYAAAYISMIANSKFMIDEGSMKEIGIPNNHREAMASVHAARWEQAEKVEIDKIEAADTYDLVPEAEVKAAGEPILGSKMAYDVKGDEANNLTQWRARGVVVGTGQKKGLNYDEICSTTVRFASIRFILALALPPTIAI